MPQSGQWQQAAVGQKCQFDWLGEGILDLGPGRLVVINVAGHHSQVVDERRGCDLLVERVLRTRRAQSSPYLRHILIERKDGICIIDCEAIEPAFQARGLRRIPSVPEVFNALPEFADRNQG
jgi:hypothetical protein